MIGLFLILNILKTILPFFIMQKDFLILKKNMKLKFLTTEILYLSIITGRVLLNLMIQIENVYIFSKSFRVNLKYFKNIISQFAFFIMVSLIIFMGICVSSGICSFFLMIALPSISCLI